MNRLGDVVTAFIARWQDKSIEGAVRKAIQAELPAIAGASPPINIEAAARCVGISQVIVDEMGANDGLLNVTPSGGYVVTLNRNQSAARKRFTLAHEIGHILVNESLKGNYRDGTSRVLSCQSTSKDETGEEKLCDRIAAELLMPKEPFYRAIEKAGVCAGSLPAIAKEFSVSLQSACKRAVQVLPYELGVSHWRMNDLESLMIPAWYVKKGGVAQLPYAIEVGKAGSECFADAQVRGWRWIPLFGHLERYFVDICPMRRNGNSWLALFMFDSAAQQIMARISRPDYASKRQMSMIAE